MKILIILGSVFLLSTFIYCDRLEEISVHVELLEMDLNDFCSNMSASSQNVYLRKPNAYRDKLNSQKKFGHFSKYESEDLKNAYNLHSLDVPMDLEYRWNILSKMGDIELSEADWISLSKFQNDNEHLAEEIHIPCDKIPCSKIPCETNTTKECKYSKTDVLKLLATSRDPNILRAAWSVFQEEFLINGQQYPAILKLVKKAAKLNGYDSPTSYWETLVEYPNAYSKAENLWNEVEPLYRKLHNFVLSRLKQFYRFSDTEETIPVYYLGSLQGIDWTPIVDKILPHRYLYDEIQASLIHDKIGGRTAYELAEKLTSSIGLKKMPPLFWQKSVFNDICPSRFLPYCAEKYSQVITCNKTDWIDYLNAHEDVVRASLDNLDDSANAYDLFRHSIVDETLVDMSSILAIKNLHMSGIIPEEALLNQDQENNQMTVLLLTALRILPKLPYYLLADTWRLQQFENESANMSTSWWEKRNTIQLVKGVSNEEWDFLADPYMNSNKPYIGKFFATFLQFQFLEYFEQHGDESVNILRKIASDESFQILLKSRRNEDWMSVLQEQFYIYNIEADALLHYFKPLEEYFETAPEKQVTQTVKPRTTSTTTTTTTEPPREHVDSQLISDDPRPELVDSKKVPLNEVAVKSLSSTTEKIAKNDTSTKVHKAVWIAPLIVVVCVLLIAGIVGNRKCRRKPSPQNRRFDA